jgi:hypothetical protein
MAGLRFHEREAELTQESEGEPQALPSRLRQPHLRSYRRPARYGSG